MSDQYLNVNNEFLGTDNTWVRVGTVMSLHMKSLLSGRTIVAKDYVCTDVGLTASLENSTIIRKNTIVIYDVTDNCIQQNKFYHKLQDLTIKNISNFVVRFEVLGMSELVVNALELIRNAKPIVCKMSFCDKYLVEVNCIDCGEKAAKWISGYLEHSNLRLAYVSAEPEHECQFWYWLRKLRKLESDDRNIVMPYASIPRYTLLSYQSLTELNRTSTHHLTLEQLNPDICIMPRFVAPFNELEWDWILIGNAIMKNIRPWKSRVKLVPEQMPIDMKMNMMLLHCELQASGNVQVGDGVYVRQIKKK
ncbi:mitochondrial amidoxime reducing component 2-like isoform X2 [Odontomachus brunneus]|uniref:mitochondrial amidoxime reducing component 2-like isoform X2 n=1 Tax=Odontomachus brunneus TaxID=486640 RepID=UPI0013F26826|nr:mitochondrial amidoxime reducing component 2-like isoform X2 [Odontomachus brunneus]